MLTTGEILKEEREKRNLTLADIEKTTRIRKKNLEAIEKNDWENFSSKTYILGIIKSYGKFLHLDEEKLAAFFRREYEKKEEVRFKQKISKSHLTSETKKMFQRMIAFILLAFFLYFGYQLKIYFSPPKVEIISPKVTVFKREEKITLIGKTEKEAMITVNGERVYQNKDNVFSVTVPLSQSKNEVIIEVIGANGRKTTIKKIFKKQ